MGEDDLKRTVAKGYDLVSKAYRTDHDPVADATYRGWLDPILKEKTTGSTVLDLGCGCGIPAAEILSERFTVTGVDVSQIQVERARSLVPDAKFVVGDMTTVSFPDASFDAIVSLYAIIHVPVAEQPNLIRSMYRWLKGAGLALVIVGSQAWTGTQEDWLGVEGAKMYWSHTDADTYRRWFASSGFVVLEDIFVPEGDGGHQKLLLRKPQMAG